jgi:hypothetical protein
MRTSKSISLATVGLAAVVAGALTVGSVPVATAAPGGPGQHAGTVLTLTAETEQFAVVDVGSPGPALGLGDQIVSSDRLTRFGKPAGRGATVMTVVATSPTALTTQLLTTLDLPDGQIILQGIGDGPTGPPTDAIEFTLAVTGGTGRYQNAHGSADIVDRPGGVENIALRLTTGRS